MSQKTMQELQAEIEALQTQLKTEKAATDEVKREYHEKDRLLVVSFKLPEKAVSETKSGNKRYVNQHYRYWTIPGLDGVKVKLDVIQKVNANNE